MAKMDETVVVRAPINIALIKYWGKRNEKLIIPCNDSISLSIDDLYAETKIRVSNQLNHDSVVINDETVDLEKKRRFQTVFKEFRSVAFGNENGPPFVSVDSTTNFTTSSGLASSAAGFAAIAYGLGLIGKLDEKAVVRLARIGSGSACRSVLKGFVHWIAGKSSDSDKDTTCETIPCYDKWKQLRTIIFEFKNSSKEVSSTDGMKRTLETSELFAHRVENVVPNRVLKLKHAIRVGDFEELSQITMADSNQLHAVCLDSVPPLIYLNDNSRRLIDFVLDYNKKGGSNIAAYTFDAGPNCCVFIEEANVSDFLEKFKNTFHISFPLTTYNGSSELPLKNIFVSRVGGGPSALNY